MPVEIVKPGLLTTLQDRGRIGLAHLGIGRAGAFDAPALRIANALCGNPRDACALEITLLGPTLRFRDDAWIALTGAPLEVRLDGATQPLWSPVFVAAGATLTLGAMRSGCRSYLAVRGGFDVKPVLGSRSTDVNAGIGPFGGHVLRAGDVLPIGPAANAMPMYTHAIKWQLDSRAWFPHDPHEPLRLLPGSHLEHLTDVSRKLLFVQTFTIHPDSNRVGVRLSGPSLEWASPIEMVSEGCVPGMLQLPPSGQPIAFGPEGPVSGGYPRIGQIAAVDLPRLAQLRPGDALGFTPCTFAEAERALQARARALARLESLIAARLAE